MTTVCNLGLHCFTVENFGSIFWTHYFMVIFLDNYDMFFECPIRFLFLP